MNDHFRLDHFRLLVGVNREAQQRESDDSDNAGANADASDDTNAQA